jgi:putative MFS transporter
VAGVSGRAVSITTPYLTVYLFEHFGVQGVLGMVTAMLVALCAAILILGVETAKVSLDDNGAFGDEDELAAAAAAMLHE